MGMGVSLYKSNNKCIMFSTRFLTNRNLAVITILSLGLSIIYSCSSKSDDQSPAPGGDGNKYPELATVCTDWKSGGGQNATGGEGAATIYHVTRLDDPQISTNGTLRYAATKSGSRVVVFDTVGTIHLTRPLELTTSKMSILGQTAPGDGICIADYPIIIDHSSDIIIRYIRLRLGNASLQKDANQDYDALSVNNSTNILIDHCSFSWSVDECVSCYGNKDFTLQYCFITESLRDAGHVKGEHGYCGIWGGKNASFHHNLIAHHDSRNPRFDHDYVTTANVAPVDFINNVVYNWMSNSAYGGEGSSKTGNQRQYNFINNYYKPGPSTTNKNVKARLLNPWTNTCDNCKNPEKHPYEWGGTIVPGKFYVVGNIMDCGADSVTNDNWKGVYPQGGNTESEKARCKSLERFSFPLAFTSEQTAADAYATVLEKAGCSLHRDAIDARIVTEVEGTATHGGYTYTGSKSGTKGIIDSPSDVGGWPELKFDDTIVDTDKDGIPDEWETKYGLNPNYSDAHRQSLVSGYSNLEVYASDLVKHLY